MHFKSKKLILVTIFFLSFTFTISPTPRDRLTTCIISYLIIFFYALCDCCLTNIYTKLYLEYYFRLLYNVYNMEVVRIKKINYFIFLLVLHDKFLVPPLLTP